MNKILESTKYVVENSENVKINREKISEFCKNIDHTHVKHWLKEAPFKISNLNDIEKLNFLLIFNSISFSYWGEPKWTIAYNEQKIDGAYGMIQALGRAINEGKPILDIKFLSELKSEELQKILRANIEIPLFEERLEILKEVGTVLNKKYKGSFVNLIKEANNDAVKLLDLITRNFKSFEDIEIYNGKKIYFYKRAQLLVSDISQMIFNSLNNIDQLTACADYKLPQILRRFSILTYSKALSEKVDNKIEIEKNSKEEVEIRANTIWAVELVKEELKKRFPKENSIHVNDHLWLLSQTKSTEDKPYHRTRTTSY